MELADNNISSYVSIIVLIIAVAYPIILENTSKIANKYNSFSIMQSFDDEFFQKKYTISSWKEKFVINRFEIILYVSCFSIILLFIDDDHWFSKGFAFIMTIILMISFFLWLEKNILYNNELKLFNYFKEKYEKPIQDEEKNHILKCLEEFAITFIDKDDKNFELLFHKFFYELIIRYREEHLKNKSKEAIVYPEQYYQLIKSIVQTYIKKGEHKTSSLGYTIMRGELVLPDDFQNIKISETTYGWLWHYITLMSKNAEFIKSFWAHSHQYFWTMLKEIPSNPYWDEDYTKLIDKNKEEREERENERKQFLEFHYALGGLLLYNKNYEALNYIFTFTQQQPPKYELLPYNMNDVFKWFEWFSNENNHYKNPIGWGKYHFPDLDNSGNRGQIIFSICKYICLLFIRQFKIPQAFLYYHNATNPLQLPNDNNKLYDWERSLEYFIICLNDVLKDDELLNKLNLKETYLNEFDEIDNFIINLKQDIPNRIKQNKLNAELSNQKIQQFYNSSSEILENGFKQYDDIINKDDFEGTQDDIKTYLQGTRILSNKSSFVDDDIPCINCHSALADSISRFGLNKYIPNSFLIARTHNYIINKEDLIKAIDIIKGNKRDIKIIAFNLEWECLEILKQNNYDKIIKLPSTDLRNFIFILEEKDLPKFTFKNIKKEEVQKYQLKKINKKHKIYGSIIDLNLSENEELRKECQNNINDDELKVLEVLAFITEIRFRADRKIVQLKINPTFEKQKKVSQFNDIEAL